MGVMRIEIVIDELVLTGFDPRERHRIADAIQGRLAALVTPADVAPLVAPGARIPELRARDVTLPARVSGMSPASVADGASRAIVAALRIDAAPAAAAPAGKGTLS